MKYITIHLSISTKFICPFLSISTKCFCPILSISTKCFNLLLRQLPTHPSINRENLCPRNEAESTAMLHFHYVFVAQPISQNKSCNRLKNSFCCSFCLTNRRCIWDVSSHYDNKKDHNSIHLLPCFHNHNLQHIQ